MKSTNEYAFKNAKLCNLIEITKLFFVFLKKKSLLCIMKQIKT